MGPTWGRQDPGGPHAGSNEPCYDQGGPDIAQFITYKTWRPLTCWCLECGRFVDGQRSSHAFDVLGRHPEWVLGALVQVVERVAQIQGQDASRAAPRAQWMFTVLDDVRTDRSATIGGWRLPGDCDARARHFRHKQRAARWCWLLCNRRMIIDYCFLLKLWIFMLKVQSWLTYQSRIKYYIGLFLIPINGWYQTK